ncbi:M3 family metallopeptidase [Marisediminicola senii]|uniref:M3 family metallopeptidase n=1 Tax=Marisediminicola senii TaxID=2711233 RepID=UPI0013E9E907|nr:M3 family metallopeptidase [Marisediminicola senii]
MPDTNPFLAPSTLPFGLPPFAEIADEHYLPAFERGFEEQLAEVAAITGQADEPTVENTLVALERSGRLLARVSAVFYNRSSADTSDAINAIEETVAPMMAAHSDAIRLDPELYRRIVVLHDGLDAAGDDTTGDDAPALDAETRYLIERYAIELTQAGAGLDEAAKTTLRGYNQQLSTLTTRFEKNLLTDTNALAVVIDDVAELDGLGAGEISAAAQAATERGLDGKYVITLVLPTGHPYLASLTNRDVRRRIMEASRSRGGRGGENDNSQLVLDITRIRAQRAALLGFSSHAAYVTAGQTAGTPGNVASMLGRLAPAAARNADREREALLAVADVDTIEAWDWAFYSERVRRAEFDIDKQSMRPYFEAERVLRDGVFFAAGQVYGVTFTERPDLTAYHPQARVFEVAEADGSPVGLYILDLYTRDSKRGGAWMNSLISQSDLLRHPTVVVNNLNVPQPAPGSPTLLSFDEVVTLFHEFGHALHGLFARVTYPKFSGTRVFRDFVEFPSQVNEMWMLWPEVLANYARHHETGERMPQHLVDAIAASSTFNEGFATSEYLAATLLDQAWHAIGTDADVTDVAAFEAAALTAAGLDNPAVPTRYSSTYFAHTFSGGYAAAYYSYIWSEVLDADTVEWFTENGGMTRQNGDRFRELVLGVGGSMDPLAAYRAFRGRDAAIEPLLRRRGLE